MYLALYRKFRPNSFDEMIGQEHITKTLTNQIKNNQIGHAYLFCGSRGTGKTSAAKIFARAVNCEKNKNGSPCGKCQACIALNELNSMDVIEIDAASNNRVDEVREIRERAKYPPVNGRYKVYIIDEVHMLTESAFNALLKTLEEPPKHVVFILATTEAHKLPATILSRVLRFDFKLLSTSSIETLLKKVFKQAGIASEPEAVNLIAVAGEGSARDALSIADMCAAYASNNITYNDVLEVLGASNKSTLISLARQVLLDDAGGYLTTIKKFSESGKNLQSLAKDLTALFRDIILIKTTKDALKMLNLPQDVFNEMKTMSENPMEQLNACLQAFSKAGQELKFALNQELLLSAVGLELINSFSKLETQKKTNVEEKAAIKPVEKGLASVNEGNEKPEVDKDFETTSNARQVWGKVLLKMDEKGLLLLHPICGKISNVSLADNSFTISTNSETEQKLLTKEQNFSDLVGTFRALGYNYNITVNYSPESKAKELPDAEVRLKEKFGGKLKITD